MTNAGVVVLGAVLLIAPGFTELGITSAFAADVAAGQTITSETADSVKDLISPGVLWSVHNGMDLNIVPYEKIPIPAVYQKATEKFSGQVTLDPKNALQNYVAGKPFPAIDNADPKAAVKIMYDFLHTHYFTDDLNLHLVDADTGALYIDANGNRHYAVERHFISDWLRILAYNGRIRHEPMPAIPDNKDEAFRKSGLYPLIEPFDLKGVGGISIRYIDEGKQDDTWLYLPALRRVRRLSSAQRSDALFGQDIDVDSYGGYAGQIPWFDWKLLGEKPMLASLHGTRLPPEPCKKDGGMTFCENWEKRPAVWVIEGKPKVAGYAYSKRVIYVDKESNFIIYSDLYDNNDELWKVVMQSIRTSTKPNPKAALEYPEPRMFIYAFSVIDMQLMHGTRAAIPGLAFQDEAGWYIDSGFDSPQSVNDDWFKVSSLIGAGR